MTVAMTLQAGESQGEYLRELNPKWQKKKKDLSNSIDKASR